jgi:tRNA (cmo5U34)-methyltransferase
VVIIADLIMPATSEAVRLAGREWDFAVKQQSRTLRGDDSAFDSFLSDEWNMYTNKLDEIDKPSSLFDQLLWLKYSGFSDVDVYWMRAGHVIFGGTKR